METSSQKSERAILWTFIHDKDDNIFISRNGRKLQIKGITLPRVIDVEIATEEMLSKTSLDMQTSDAVAIILADNKSVVLRVSNFRCSGGFSDEFRNAKTSSAFLKTFMKVTSTCITDTEPTLSDTCLDTSTETLEPEVIPDTQLCPVRSQSIKGRKNYVPPIISSNDTTCNLNADETSTDLISTINNKMLTGTHNVKLSNISEAPSHIRFREIDEDFVQQIKNDMDFAKFTTPQPLALLVVSDWFDPKQPLIDDMQFVCLGGNHLRMAYELCSVSSAEAKVYFGLTDEEALFVSKMHNDIGHYIKKMTNFDLILLLRRQLNPSTDERVTDLVNIKAWRNKISKILPKEKSIKSIQPLLNIAMASKTVYEKVVKIYNLYAAGDLKGQKPKQKRSSSNSTIMNNTSTWKSMMAIDDDLVGSFLQQVIDKDLTMEEMQRKCDEIKKYRNLQRKIMRYSEKTWPEVVTLYYNGNNDEAEISLHPYLGMSESPEFEIYIHNLSIKEDTSNNNIHAVKDVKAADFVFLAEDEVKEETVRKIHAINIAAAIPSYTIMSFKSLEDVVERVADFSYGRIAILCDQRKKPDTQFTELKMLFVAQFGTKVITTRPGTTATQLFNLKDNCLLPIFHLFCQERSKVLIFNSNLFHVIQSFKSMKCNIYVHVSNSQQKRNLKRKCPSVGEE